MTTWDLLINIVLTVVIVIVFLLRWKRSGT